MKLIAGEGKLLPLTTLSCVFGGIAADLKNRVTDCGLTALASAGCGAQLTSLTLDGWCLYDTVCLYFCLCMCLYVYVYVCSCMCVCSCLLCAFVCMQASVYMSVHVCVCARVCVKKKGPYVRV